MSDTIKRPHGYLAEFDGTKSLYHAAEHVRDAGFKHWDVFSPFPIHGMDDAMGLKKSLLPKIVLFMGCMGTLTALVLQYSTQVFIYPTVVQAKPANLFTIPAFFPIIFELTVLFAAFTAFFCAILLGKLPRHHHPLFNSDRFKAVTDDGFFLCIEAKDPQFSKDKTLAFLEGIGAKNIELVEEEL